MDLVIVSQKDPYTNVEFLLVYQHGAFYVFLNYEAKDS